LLPVALGSARIATGVAVPLALAVPVVILARYGAWVFAGPTGRLWLVGFFSAAAVLVAAGAGLFLSVGLAAMDLVRRRMGAVGAAVLLVLITVVWLLKMVQMVSVSVSSSAYASPLSLAAIGVGLLLVAAVARGQRPWQPSDVLALCATYAALGVAVAWLNLSYLRKADVELGRWLNIGIVVAAHGMVWVGARSGKLAPAWLSSFPSKPGGTATAFAALVLCSAIAIVPLQRLATAAGEPRAESSTPLGGPAFNATVEAAREQPPSRNVVLISIDTLRADHLGIYGYERNTSPNIDRFFSDGLVFERAYAQAPWTLPSHASMFTGQHPSTHGSTTYPGDTFGYVDRLRPELVTIAEILNDQGFETGAFTGGVYLTRAYGFDQGFETFEVARSTRMEEALDLALPWLKHEREQPFFLFLHAFDVHRYEPRRYYDDLPDDGYNGPMRGLLRERPRLLEEAIIADGLSNPSAQDIRFVQHLYDTEIRGVDAQLQRLFEALEQLGLLENTAVILTSDHGENFWEHGDSGHAFTLYNTTLQVPLLISAPGFRVGRRISGFARVIDIPATILTLTGVSTAVGERMHGRSLLAGVRVGEAGSDIVVAEADRLGTQACVFSGRYKYIYHNMPSYNVLRGRFALLTLRGLFSRFNRKEELFDLERDPGGRHNLAEEDVARAASLRTLLFQRISKLRAERGYAEVPDVELSPELKENLRALGYTD
jgi:arylsulfatase A-like enzyme